MAEQGQPVLFRGDAGPEGHRPLLPHLRAVPAENGGPPDAGGLPAALQVLLSYSGTGGFI